MQLAISPISEHSVIWLARDITDRKLAEAASILEERNRMAREIHDTLAQSFTGIIIHARAAGSKLTVDPAKAQDYLAQAQNLARTGLEEARRSVEALRRPYLLENNDLPSAFRHLIGQLESSTNTIIVCEAIGIPDPLPSEVENNLLRIGQEALTNALKYAEASEIRVELIYQSPQCILRIKDDGRGFTLDQTRHNGFWFIRHGRTCRADWGTDPDPECPRTRNRNYGIRESGKPIMSQPKPIHVLVVDDHPVVRQGLVAMLEEVPDILVVGQVGNGREAIAVCRQQQPDVTLMDLRMPELDGCAAITAICAEFPAARIIVLTTYDGDEDIYQGLRAGAKGYLLKDAEPEELLSAIRAVYKDRNTFHPMSVPNS